MGNILSTVERIHAVHFNSLTPSRGVTDIAAMTKSANRSVYIRTKRGTIYTDSGMGRSICLSGPAINDVTALYALGVISQAEMRAHFDYEERYREWRTAIDAGAETVRRVNALPVSEDVKRAVFDGVEQASEAARKRMLAQKEVSQTLNAIYAKGK